LARARDKKTRDLGNVRCVKNEEGRVLTEDTKIWEGWRSYFYKFYNDKLIDHPRSMGGGRKEGQPDYGLCDNFSKEEIKDTLKKMKAGKALGPDGIPVEIWKYLGEHGVEWLTDLFNVIFRYAKMPRE